MKIKKTTNQAPPKASRNGRVFWTTDQYAKLIDLWMTDSSLRDIADAMAVEPRLIQARIRYLRRNGVALSIRRSPRIDFASLIDRAAAQSQSVPKGQ